MQNYFRITAYHPTENISVIIDSYGKFEKLWQFSSYMVSKGFKIIAVNKENEFNEGNISKIMPDAEKLTIQAYSKGKPITTDNKITIGEKTYLTKFKCD